LLQDARRGSDSEAEQYVLLQKALSMAESSGDARIGLQALARLEKQWELPADHPTRADVVRTALSAARRPEDYDSIVRSGLGAVETLLSRGEYRQADTLASALRSAAARSRDRELVAAAGGKQQRARQALAVYRRVEPSFETLEESPDDAEANLAVGRFYAFQFGQWERALPRLAKGSDADLAGLAEADLAEPEQAGAQKALGDRYWQQAAQRGGGKGRALRDRARYWYRLSLDQLSGNERDLVLRRATSPDAINWAGRVYNPGVEVRYKLGEKTYTRSADELAFDWRSKPPVPSFAMDERFKVTVAGYLRAPEEGWYTFELNTRFRTSLRIHDRLVYDARGGAAFERWLYKGLNRFELEHDVHPRTEHRYLSLEWAPPGEGSPEAIDPTRLYHLLGQNE